jgi:GNAT superfamily N-acetyltransferase
MLTRQATASQPPREIAVTASGAHLSPIDPKAAAAFLARLDEPSPQPIDIALGALEDNGMLIGVAVLRASSPERAWVTVAVAPPRRRLKVASDLLTALVGLAAEQGLRYLACSHPLPTPSQGLAASVGLVTARRVHQGVETVVIIVPSQA